MKILLMIIMLAGAAAAQLQMQCVYDSARPGINATEYSYGVPYQTHRPEWSPTRPEQMTLKLAAGKAWRIPVFMPVAGRCSGWFTSIDDRADTTKVFIAAAGKYVPLPPNPVDDIEIAFINAEWLQAFDRQASHPEIYSTGRSNSGAFTVDLPAGVQYLVINNNFSQLGAKLVRLSFGGEQPENPAPFDAPLTSETRSVYTQPDADTPPPKLTKHPKQRH